MSQITQILTVTLPLDDGADFQVEINPAVIEALKEVPSMRMLILASVSEAIKEAMEG
jgi:hypothetical protein